MPTSNRLAIEALKKEIQKIAFDANLYDRGLATYPHAENSSKLRKKLLAQLRRLQEPDQLKFEI